MIASLFAYSELTGLPIDSVALQWDGLDITGWPTTVARRTNAYVELTVQLWFKISCIELWLGADSRQNPNWTDDSRSSLCLLGARLVIGRLIADNVF
jgi:hypothetical protein